ncbi:alpha/beta hydrolase-fold protein [Pseudoalteromonas xiamenensis]
MSIHTLTLLALLLNCFVRAEALEPSIGPKVTYHQIQSKQMTSSLRLKVVLPNSYLDKSTYHYPLLLTLAGESQINSVIAQVDWLSHVSFGPMPEVILVQLPQLNTSDAIAKKVVIEEILPHLRTQFRLAPFTMIEGFSTSGVAALDYFAEFPTIFQATIVSSPAFGLKNDAWLAELIAKLKANLGARYLYVSKSGFNDDATSYEQLKASLTHFTNAHFADLSQQNYLSTSLIGFEQGVKTLFEVREITNFEPFAREGLSSVLEYHKMLYKRFGFQISDTDNLMGLAGYYFKHMQTTKANQVYEYMKARDEKNVLIQVRHGQALLENGLVDLAKEVFSSALKLAHAQNNTEAVEFIQHHLERL